MARADPIETALAPVMKAAGYSKLRRNWHKPGPAVIRVLTASKSSWGDQFRLELGFYLRALGAEQRPPSHRCQVQLHHLGDLTPDRARLHRLLDFEDRSMDGGRLEAIVHDVVRYGLPWLEAHPDEESLARLIVANPTRPLAWLSARRHLASRFPSIFESATLWARPELETA